MRTSLVTRLLTVSLTIAVVAVVATAWLATRTTTDRLVGEFNRSLEADGFVYGQLTEHAANHQGWETIGPLVDELAQRTGQRIALTTQDGEPIADSAIDPQPPPLPSQPSALIDPLAPLLTVHGADTRPGLLADLPPAMSLPRDDEGRDVVTGAAGLGLCSVDPGLWDDGQGRSELEQLVATADAVGEPELLFVPSWMPDSPDLQRWLDDAIDAGSSGDPLPRPPAPPRTPRADGAPAEQSLPIVLTRGCDHLDVALPDPDTDRLHWELREEIVACMDAADVAHGVELARWTKDRPEPGTVVEHPEPDLATGPDDMLLYQRVLALPEDGRQTSAATSCAEEAHRRLLGDHLAEPALLYLGSAETGGVFAAAGRGRLLAAVAAVLAVTLGVTMFAGRRLLRPVRSLTSAAERLAEGERDARAHVHGNDELGRLGASFNTMATNLEETERQRRTLISDVAHELRSPITTLRGYLEGAADGLVEVDDKLLRALHGDTVLLQRLVDDLQELALADAGVLDLDITPVDVGDLLHQVVASHRSAAESAGIDLDAATDGPVIVQADAARLRQVAGNLVGNAVRYTPAGGQVRATCRTESGDAILAVSDTGVGIPPAHLPHVFDRFYRVDDSRSRETGGAGIGLAIVRAIVEAHGGRVEVASEPNEGTTFTVHLPAQRVRS